MPDHRSDEIALLIPPVHQEADAIQIKQRHGHNLAVPVLLRDMPTLQHKGHAAVVHEVLPLLGQIQLHLQINLADEVHNGGKCLFIRAAEQQPLTGKIPQTQSGTLIERILRRNQCINPIRKISPLKSGDAFSVPGKQKRAVQFPGQKHLTELHTVLIRQG